MEKNIYDIIKQFPGALKGRDNGKGIRIMHRNRIIIRQDDRLILHTINDDGLMDVYCAECGEYITSTYKDMIVEFPLDWVKRKQQMYSVHHCAQSEVAATRE